MSNVQKRVKVSWYKVIYSLNDNRLIAYFWRWYNSHKVKSKDRAARNVLIRYYSTTSVPVKVQKLLTLNRDIKLANFSTKEFYELL